MALQASVCKVSQLINSDRFVVLPVSGAGANVPVGTILMAGATGGTNIGVMIPITASSNLLAVGLLSELHNFSASGDATTATLVPWFANPGNALASGNTAYPSHPVNILDTSVLLDVDYGLDGNIAVASATSTVVTITNLAANADSSFFYVVAGTGIGQVAFAKTTSAGSFALISALGTNLDSTSTLTQVLPIGYDLITWKVNSTTVPCLIDSAAAAGSGRAVILENHMLRNQMDEYMDPKQHHKLTGLNSLASLRFFARLAMQNAAFHPFA